MNAKEKRESLSFLIAQLMPNIIQGVHIGFLAKRELTHTQFFVMVAIHSQVRPAMSTLSDNMQVSMPTMTGIIERLVKGGYVKRVPHPEDRRQVLVELTPHGKGVIKEFQAAATKRWQQVLPALDAREVEAFQGIVTKLKNSLGKNHDENS